MDHAEFLLVLIVEQPDLTLDEIVEAIRSDNHRSMTTTRPEEGRLPGGRAAEINALRVQLQSLL